MRMYTVMYICIYARRFVGRCGVHANKYGGVGVCVHENLYRRVCVCLSIVCLQYCMHKRTCMYAVLYTRMHMMLCVRLCLCRHVCLCSVRIHTNTCICVWMCVFLCLCIQCCVHACMFECGYVCVLYACSTVYARAWVCIQCCLRTFVHGHVHVSALHGYVCGSVWICIYTHV
jgi:hypothetical protein